MFIGYARVSTDDQSLDLQADALKKAGCEKIFFETASGARTERIQLKEALDYIRSGDTLVVWRLDRLGRSLRHLIEVINSLEERGIGFRSVQEGFDTSTNGGKLIFHMFGALAEFERNLIRERTMAGLAAARARGRKGGRRPKLNPDQVTMAKTLMADRNNNPNEIAKMLGISRSTLYRVIR